MVGEPRPLLALGPPEVGVRIAQRPRRMPRLSTPDVARQGARLSPQFRQLAEAFARKRVELSGGATDEPDPEFVVVFDLAGTVEQFRNAVAKIDGFEFLTEYLDDDVQPDDDFFMEIEGEGPTSATVTNSLYAVMSDAAAVDQLVRLFEVWKKNPAQAFAHGLGRFRAMFLQLRRVRRWGPEDRVHDTGLVESWRETLAVVGAAQSTVLVEVELWYRREPDSRDAAESAVRALVEESGGTVRSRGHVGEIGYHALLVALPIQNVETVVKSGVGAIKLLCGEQIEFVSPYTPMSVSLADGELVQDDATAPGGGVKGVPRVAILDGLPFTEHSRLRGRLTIDDPEDVGSHYPVASRRHGTAMCSLLAHGDLSEPGPSMARPIYVRPITQPHPVLSDQERVVDTELLVDLLHRSIRRIIVGEGEHGAAAPSVRVVLLAIGAESRAFVRRVSPVGRLLDWLAVEYNLLFIVSAGNHLHLPITIPAKSAIDAHAAAQAALEWWRATSRLRGVLPPGDAMNALTVGSASADRAGPVVLPSTTWDIVGPGMPALYGATGPGVGRSVKPELIHDGGRAVYAKPIVSPNASEVELRLAPSTRSGPGVRVAAPGRLGELDSLSFIHGSSVSAALVAREADRLFDLLEGGADQGDLPFPSAEFHPVAVRALLVHASSWGDLGRGLRESLSLDNMSVRKELVPLLGYGRLDVSRLGAGATNRAVLFAGASIGRNMSHTYHVPLPPSLRARAEWHRFTVTLACLAPTVGTLNRYRVAKVYFRNLDLSITRGTRIEAKEDVAKRGTVQQEIVEGRTAMTFGEDGTLPIRVECMDQAQRLGSGKLIRYALVVSVETAVTVSETVHDEIRARLRIQARERARGRLRA